MSISTDRSRIAFLASCTALVFGYGVGVGHYGWFPWTLMKSGRDAVRSVMTEAPSMAGVRPTAFLHPARYDGDGATVLIEDRVWDGRTLIAGFFDGNNEVRLVELDGTPVHRWPVSFSALFPDPQHLAGTGTAPSTDWNADLHGVLALPDGSILFNFEYLGLAKLDRCGSVEWTLSHMTHHSIERAAGGGFWVPGRRYLEAVDGYPARTEPYLDDRILRISDEGRIVVEKSVAELFADNGLRALLLAGSFLAVYPRNGGEIAHLNDIEELPASLADRFPQFAPGDLALSFRNRNLVMVVDPETWTVKWHQTGPWMRQHDPDFTTWGTISIYSNNSDDTPLGSVLGGSEIVEVDPSSGNTTRRYGGEGQEMFTNVRGKHQLLPNGNLLITQFEAGRLIEVADDGDIVWEFINRYDDDEVAEVTQAIRYAPTYFEVDDWACDS